MLYFCTFTGLVGEDHRQLLLGKGLQLLLRSGVVLVVRVDRRVQRSGVGEDGAGHVADEDRYWSCETLTSS